MIYVLVVRLNSGEWMEFAGFDTLDELVHAVEVEGLTAGKWCAIERTIKGTK